MAEQKDEHQQVAYLICPACRHNHQLHWDGVGDPPLGKTCMCGWELTVKADGIQPSKDIRWTIRPKE